MILPCPSSPSLPLTMPMSIFNINIQEKASLHQLYFLPFKRNEICSKRAFTHKIMRNNFISFDRKYLTTPGYFRVIKHSRKLRWTSLQRPHPKLINHFT